MLKIQGRSARRRSQHLPHSRFFQVLCPRNYHVPGIIQAANREPYAVRVRPAMQSEALPPLTRVELFIMSPELSMSPELPGIIPGIIRA